MPTQRDYNVAATAILALAKKQVPVLVPFWAQNFIPWDKAPIAAMAAAKVAIDAVDADRSRHEATLKPPATPPVDRGIRETS